MNTTPEQPTVDNVPQDAPLKPRKVDRLNVQPSARDARKFGRVKVEFTNSSLGDVLDISGGGMRVRSTHRLRFKLGDVVDIGIGSPHGKAVARARIVWLVKNGWRRTDLGCEFLGLTPEARETLRLIGRSCASNEVICSSIKEARRAS